MDLVMEPGTHLKDKTVFSTSNMIRISIFSSLDAAMKQEIAEIKKILSDGSVSESGSDYKFTIN